MAAILPEEAAALVAAASRGDSRAWEKLVDAYVGLIWAVTRSYRLSDGDAHDVSQTTWLRLVENIGRLTDPSRVGAWLATTARRECLRVLRQSNRSTVLHDWKELDLVDPAAQDIDAEFLRTEQGDAVRSAVAQLSPPCQALLQLLMIDPPPSYEEVSAALGVPVGSIGPTRGRCLRKLEALMEAAVSAGGPTASVPG